MTHTSEDVHTGVFGGTFNPIHLGHLRAAEEVVEHLGLQRMIFVPSGSPPHKSLGDELAPAGLRLDWVRRAIEDNPRFQVDSLELEREGPSFTVDTLRVLGRSVAPERPVFVIGQDAFTELDTWKSPDELLTLTHFALISRPPAIGNVIPDCLPRELCVDLEISRDGRTARHRKAGTWIRVVPTSALEISSSEIREQLRSGQSVRYLLPEGVREAVEKSEAFGSQDRPQGGGES